MLQDLLLSLCIDHPPAALLVSRVGICFPVSTAHPAWLGISEWPWGCFILECGDSWEWE